MLAKTKILKVRNLEVDGHIFLEGALLEVVKNFTYLEAFNRMLVILLKNMSKVELKMRVNFSDDFKLFRDSK